MKKNRLLKDSRAVETLEAAITTPIAILVMLAIINLGMVVYAQQAVEQAARQGARMGSVAQSSAAYYASSNAQEAIEEAMLVQNPKVTILAASGTPGSVLRVKVEGTVPSFFGRLLPLVADDFTVSAEADFRQEGW